MCLLLSSNFFAENFRVGKVHSISLDSNSLTSQTECQKIGISEALAIYLPEDQTFIEGIEIKMDIPESVASWMDSVACSVYDKINPLPNPSQIDYSGVRQYVSTLPGRLSWVLQIPIKENNSIKANNYTTKIDCVPEFKDKVIFIRLQPVMKGVPEETLKALIPMTVKPLLIDKGQLVMNINNPEGTDFPCTVYIDDSPVEYNKEENKVLLSSGIHTISIISDSYRNEVRTVRIDQAKVTNLDILMKSTEPTLIITAPESALIYLDDKKCDTIGKEFVISEGEHKIKFTMGDYEIIRSIQAIQGKTYTANFSVDLEILEE
ncbi:MAG: hypothetical protein K5866_07560 [Treponema sp.]|nr:hypothetical protein [Treponema sp.]